MILDKTLTLSENQAITATAISTNVIDFGSTGTVYGDTAALIRNLGPGNELPVLMQVTQDFNNLTSLQISLETSDNEDLSSSDVLYTTGAIPLASLVAGYRTPLRILPDGEIKRYLGIRYTVVGTAPTAGTVTAAVATEVNAG